MVTTIVEDNVEEDFWSMATMTTVMMTTMVIMKLMAMNTVISMIVISGTEREVISVFPCDYYGRNGLKFTCMPSHISNRYLDNSMVR